MHLLKGSSPDIIHENKKTLKQTGKYSDAQCTAIAMKHSKKGMAKKMKTVADKVVKSEGLI